MVIARAALTAYIIYINSVKQESGFVSFVILAVYVDDIIPVSNDPEMLASEKKLLSDEFQMVDQGELQFILGMSVKRDREKKTLFISQEKYLERIVLTCRIPNQYKPLLR